MRLWSVRVVVHEWLATSHSRTFQSLLLLASVRPSDENETL
jgi:hypothetical protein